MLLALYSLWGSDTASSTAAAFSRVIVPGVSAPVYAPGAASDDIRDRLVRELPSGWFARPAPIRDAILGGAADVLARARSLFTYAKAQMRLSSAMGFWIDLISYDFLGLTSPRRAGEVDALYSARVRKEITRERVTKAGMYQALLDLTGKPPIIFEPFISANAGGWDVSAWGWDVGNGSSAPAELNGNQIGWGDQADNQAFVTVFQSGVGVGVANSGGLDTGLIGFDVAGQWVDQSMIAGAVTQQDILDTINRTKPAGVMVWVRIV